MQKGYRIDFDQEHEFFYEQVVEGQFWDYDLNELIATIIETNNPLPPLSDIHIPYDHSLNSNEPFNNAVRSLTYTVYWAIAGNKLVDEYMNITHTKFFLDEDARELILLPNDCNYCEPPT
jgi:hypothetical protein